MRKLAIIACSVLSAVLTATAVAAPRVYYRLPLTDRPVVKPKRIEFRDLDLTRIHWTGWGKRTAAGSATASSLSCHPSCAEGHRYHGTATLRMFKRHRKGTRRYYGCMTGRVRAGKASGPVEWPPGCASGG